MTFYTSLQRHLGVTVARLPFSGLRNFSAITSRKATTVISRYVSLAILAVLMLILGVTFFRVLAPFLLPLFLAAVVALIAQPVYNYFLKRTKNRPTVAAGMATGTIVAAVIIPLFIGITVGALQLFVAAEQLLDDETVQRTIDTVKQGEIYESVIVWGEQFFPIVTAEYQDRYSEEDLKEWREEVLEQRAENLRESVQNGLKRLAVITFSAGTAFTTVDILAKTGWTLMGLITFVMALYYFFCEGPNLLQHAIDLIPVDVNHQRTLFQEFGTSIRAVVSATFLAALAQGIATSVALWALGFGHFFLFTIVATFSALIPLAGTWLVWLPCAVYLAYQGSWIWALLLAVYGFGLVGTLDNIIRAYVLHSDAKLHPLLAFVSVLGGLQVMGLWGVFIAPVVASCLYALIRIFNEELVDISRLQRERPPANFPDGEGKAEQTKPEAAAAKEQADDKPDSSADKA